MVTPIKHKLVVSLTESQYETLVELQEERFDYLTLNEIIVKAILELSKREI